MVATALCFAAMNALYVVAMALGSAANAVLLQYTAPMWMYLASVFWLGEPADRRSSVALLAGLLGIAVIIYGGWEEAQLSVVAIALGSGVAYAGVILGLRVLRAASPRWLTVVNHLSGALVLLPRGHRATPSREADLDDSSSRPPNSPGDAAGSDRAARTFLHICL